jgi:propionate CoA-transferase
MGKAQLKLGDGKLVVEKEGSIKKFVHQVEQITFSGKYAKKDQTVLYVTERCVFRLIDGKMVLVEIAPGINLANDILAQMDFRPEIAQDLKQMDPAIFHETWGGLSKYIR